MSFNHSVADLVEQSNSELLAIAPWWKRVEIGAVASILNGYPWQSIHFNSVNGEPLIRIRDVTTGRSETRYSGPIEEGYWIHDGDLVVGMDGDFNSRIWEGGRGLLNQRVCRIMPDENFYSRRFLAHVLPGYLKEINEATHSITVKHLSSKTLEETPVPLPPLSEQRRIVANLDGLLGRTTRARKELDRVPVLVERFREAILERAFSGLADGSARFAPLSELVDGQRGIPYGIVQTGKYFVDGVPTVRAGDIKRFRIVRESLKQVEPTIAAEYKRTLLRGGEVLVSIRGTVGNVAVAHTELAGCNISREVALIPLLGDVSAKFLMFFIASPNVQRFLKRHTKGVAQSGVNLEDLRRLPTPVLSMKDQHEIVRRIESAFAWLDKLAAEHARASALLPKLEQALLAKAFRGELVPQDPNDEPASVLLERIRAERAAAPERQRKSRSSDLPRAPRQRAAMTKSRLDQDVMHQPYLAKHLRDAGGSAKVEDLFRSADLPVTDFYKQLAWEVEAGHVNDQGALLEAA